ncbi:MULTISPECIES: ABC transporter substrate-binding protein [Stappiaceae]|jgi:putative hydroxymethylpyrimidine transport system substrate-binding protein|uniref:ABC transporter ATP-binding protein n=2 Tax=Roseibium TaxID=150830 RepID=A0ABN4WTA2_9HYPH|nr:MULTISPECIES: ABC transporter substrate-binding protein [Stappiaceae]MCR9284159.1 ABC transporter substrate-binding protein [Paracoccaceae bacterium]MEC9420778.1 ABC transporter substrate-binding protein [Pseudomonadota bacterium]AMN51880.1 ABC transporter ATP-binding protein [Labrenzia sp. CP4]AQQ04965.1 ABC transporter ATP-binding protein [Roseibium aggregatum]ERP85938.1 ABC transporter ATP-binding protein [Labrenzia sp. C1B10]
MKKQILSLALAAGLLASGPVQASEKLTLLLDWFINPDHAPLVTAQTKGFFEAEGLEVEIIEPADPAMPPKLVAAGQGDIAVSYQPTLHAQIEEELPLKWIGTLVETPLNSLIVLKDGPIQELKDLKGKSVGFSVSGFEDAMLGQMLRSAGLTMDDVELVNVNFALSGSLLAGQVDAVIGAYRNFELTQLEIEGKPGKAFFPEENGVPIFDELIYVVNKDKTDDPRFAKFLAAVEAATIYLSNHPEEAWNAFIEAYPNLNDELNRRAWFDTLPRFAKRPAALDEGRYQRFAEFMAEAGLISKVVPVESYTAEIR